MSSTDPSIECDCRQKSIRNVRIIAIVVAACAFILSSTAFEGASVEEAVCRILAGLGLFTYGIATFCDDTATFPRPLYALISLGGIAVTALAVSALL